MDQRQRRQQIQMGSIAQCQPQVSSGKARMLAHDRLGSRPFSILNRVNHDAVMILRNDQDLMRLPAARIAPSQSRCVMRTATRRRGRFAGSAGRCATIPCRA